MNEPSRRPLDLGPVRAFEAVARHLSFRAAAEELFLTQSAISRQVKALEEEIGTVLLRRGTRSVEVTAAGRTLLAALIPALEHLDATVRRLRSGPQRAVVNVSTFASMASLWLLPRLEAFEETHPDSDIRVASKDALIDVADPEHDVILRHGSERVAPPGAERLFGDWLTPVLSPWLWERAQSGDAPPLREVADLAAHRLIEQDDHRVPQTAATWRSWLVARGHPALEPRRWVYLNYTYQQIQAVLAGQGVTLARLAMVADLVRRGDLVEPFGVEGRVRLDAAYWMAPTLAGRARPEVQAFMAWLREQAAATRQAMGEVPEDDPGPGEAD